MMNQDDPMTKLGDHEPGDVVVVITNDADEVVVELGAVLGVARRAKRTSAFAPLRHALVTTLDRDTLVRHAETWRSMSVDTPVVAIVARATWMREMRAINGRVQSGGGVDPLTVRDRGGRAPDEEF